MLSAHYLVSPPQALPTSPSQSSQSQLTTLCVCVRLDIRPYIQQSNSIPLQEQPLKMATRTPTSWDLDPSFQYGLRITYVRINDSFR